MERVTRPILLLKGVMWKEIAVRNDMRVLLDVHAICVCMNKPDQTVEKMKKAD